MCRADDLARGIVLLALAVLANVSMAAGPEGPEQYDQECGNMTKSGRVPPNDFRRATPEFRDLVEKFHFREHYVAYLAGKSMFRKESDGVIESPAAGFDYTLWAFPNHPQSLAAMEDIGFRQKTDKLGKGLLSVHCYFQRAVRVAADDPTVRALYAYYYARRKMPDKAREQIPLADVGMGRDDQNVQTYLAWSYIQIDDLDAAVGHARRAYALGLQLPGLRNRLAKSGRPLN